MGKALFVVLMLVACAGSAFAAKPVLQPGEHVAPPEPTAALALGTAANATAELQNCAEFLKSLDALLDDEQKVTAMVRDFDRLQETLADWDIEQASVMSRAGDAKLAEEKQASAKERIVAIETAYKRVLERYPKNARVLNYYGELLYDRLENEAEGVKLWENAAQNDATYAAPYNNLGIHYCHVGQYERGFENLDKALKLEPDNPDFLYNHVQLLLVHRKHAQAHYKWEPAKLYAVAMDEARKAMDLKPGDFHLAQDYAVNFFAAEQFGVKADWKQAVEAWARVRTMATTTTDQFYALMYEGRAAIRAGDTEHGRVALTQALALKPDSPAAKSLLDELGGPVALPAGSTGS